MDPVITFLRANRSFSLSVLLTSFSEIVSLQSTAGSVLYDDIVLKVTEASACAMEEMDVSAHAALLFESCVLPKINTKGEMTLQLKTELSGGDSSTFVKALLQIIHSKVGSEEIALKFRAEADAYLQDQASASNLEVSSDTTEVAAEPFKANWRMKREPSGSNFSGESSSRSSSLSTLAKWPTQQELNEALSDEFSMVLPASRPGPQLAEPQEPSSSVDVEKNEPMVRLLAFARRGGMDILFPQSLHDKVLACIYVVIQVAKSPAHKEIIEMVLSVRNSKCTSQLESVSKTKIRGMLGLFKHGELMTTRSADGEYVRQMISPSIRSFSDLRDKHDAFLQRFMAEHHIFVPTAMKAEILWQFDEEARAKRLQAIDKFIAQLFAFFDGYKSPNRFNNNLGINTKATNSTTDAVSTLNKEKSANSTDDESPFQSQSFSLPVRSSPVAGDSRRDPSISSMAYHASTIQGKFSAEVTPSYSSSNIDRYASQREYQHQYLGRQPMQQQKAPPMSFEQPSTFSSESRSFHQGQRAVHRQVESARDVFFDATATNQYPRSQETSFRGPSTNPFHAASTVKHISTTFQDSYHHQRVDRSHGLSQRHVSGATPRGYRVSPPSSASNQIENVYESRMLNVASQESYAYDQRHYQQHQRFEQRPQLYIPSKSQYTTQQASQFSSSTGLERESYGSRGRVADSASMRAAPYAAGTYPIYHHRETDLDFAAHRAAPHDLWGAADHKPGRSVGAVDHVDLEREFESSLLFGRRGSGNSNGSGAFSGDGDRLDAFSSDGFARKLSNETSPSLLLFRDHSPSFGPIGSCGLFEDVPASAFS